MELWYWHLYYALVKVVVVLSWDDTMEEGGNEAESNVVMERDLSTMVMQFLLPIYSARTTSINAGYLR